MNRGASGTGAAKAARRPLSKRDRAKAILLLATCILSFLAAGITPFIHPPGTPASAVWTTVAILGGIALATGLAAARLGRRSTGQSLFRPPTEEEKARWDPTTIAVLCLMAWSIPPATAGAWVSYFLDSPWQESVVAAAAVLVVAGWAFGLARARKVLARRLPIDRAIPRAWALGVMLPALVFLLPIAIAMRARDRSGLPMMGWQLSLALLAGILLVVGALLLRGAMRARAAEEGLPDPWDFKGGIRHGRRDRVATMLFNRKPPS